MNPEALAYCEKQAQRIAELEFDISNLKAVIDRLHLDYKELEQQRDGAVAIIEQTLCGISFGELRKAYSAYRAGEKYETVVDRIEAELISTKQQRDELLAALKCAESLFDRKWNGVVGSGCEFNWHPVGNWRHYTCKMTGETFLDAIAKVKQ